MFAGVKDGNDVGMAKPRRGLGFAQEAFDALRRIQHAGVGHFQCDLAIQLRVEGAIDRAKRAGAELVPHLIATNSGERGEHRRGSRGNFLASRRRLCHGGVTDNEGFAAGFAAERLTPRRVRHGVGLGAQRVWTGDFDGHGDSPAV